MGAQRGRLVLAVCFWAAPWLSTPGAGDDLSLERSRVLTEVGPVKELAGDRKIILGPLGQGVGPVFTRDHREPGARSVRLHFTVESGAQGCWAIQVTGVRDHEVWAASPADGTSFWSEEFAGDRVKVEVYSTMPANPVVISIDRIAIRTDAIKPLSITGNKNDLKTIRGQDSWIVDNGRSVARVRFVADKGGSFSCTGFLVTRDLLLTNQHCIATETERDSALVDWDYDTDRLTRKGMKLKKLEHSSFPLDYSFVRLEKAVDRVPLRLDGTHAPDAEQLLVIQHPGGEPKQVSLKDCVLKGTAVEGRKDDQGRAEPDSDFGHQCDTLTGSSGSPVFRLGTKTVVGLHHLAYDGPLLFNRAVHIDRVLADLPVALRDEVKAGQPSP